VGVSWYQRVLSLLNDIFEPRPVGRLDQTSGEAVLAPPNRVVGYHGTSGAAAARILESGFTVSRNEWDWLGDGVYFFQDAPIRAREWALRFHPDDPAVLRSDIRLEDCMDLLDIRWTQVLAEAYDHFLRLWKTTGLPLPAQRGGAHRLDRSVINYMVATLATEGTTIRAVRGAFAEGEPIFPDSAIFARAHIQIAVRDTSLIESVQPQRQTEG